MCCNEFSKHFIAGACSHPLLCRELPWLMDVMLGRVERVEAVLLARKSLVFPVLLSSETLEGALTLSMCRSSGKESGGC